MTLEDFNGNIIAYRSKKRYEQQPEDIRKKIDQFQEMPPKKYQLKVIKKEKRYPEKGDIFEIKPTDDLLLYGLVINNHVNNINGEDLLVVLIFKAGVNPKGMRDAFLKENILLPPQTVGIEYWTRGYFYTVDAVDMDDYCIDYGFFDVGSIYTIGHGLFLNEYGERIEREPELLGVYGVSTITGIASKVTRELIIDRLL